MLSTHMQVTITSFWATPTALDWRSPVLLSKAKRWFLQVTSLLHCSTWDHLTSTINTDSSRFFSTLLWNNRRPSMAWQTCYNNKWLDFCWKHTQLLPFPAFLPRVVLLFQLGGRQEHAGRCRSQLPTTHLSRLLQSLRWKTQTGQ